MSNTLKIEEILSIGTGDHAVVCLNGWFGCSTAWGSWQNLLNTQDFTWYFPDYRGYGKRLETVGDYTLEEIASDMNGLLAQLPQQKISLLGHSMGGMFMQRLLLDSPRDIDSLIGISPVPATGTPLPPEQKAFFSAAGNTPATRRAIIDMTTGGRLSDVWLDSMEHSTVRHSRNDAVSGYFTAWADSNIFEALDKRDEKILVIIGKHDPAVTRAVIENTYAKNFNNLELIELPDCGHYAMEEMPVLLATLVENFLRN